MSRTVTKNSSHYNQLILYCMPTRVYFLSSFGVTESIIWCSSKCKYFPCQHTIAPYITQGRVFSYVNRGKLSMWQHEWYKQLQWYFHLRLHNWGNEAHHFQSNVKMDSRPHFILLGPLFRLPWCCCNMIIPLMWIHVTCLLSNFVVFPVHQKKLPWSCHYL
jgi:hypothetical protein